MAITRGTHLTSNTGYARTGLTRSGYTTLDKRLKYLENLRKQQAAQKSLMKQQERYMKANNIYADYNDPFALNSLADALLNKDARKKRIGFLENIPVLDVLAGAGAVFWDNNIKPIVNSVKYKSPDTSTVEAIWKGTKAGLYNTLINVGETLDIAANPVKGAIQEGPTGFTKAMGWKQGEGRTNYDWNTKLTGNKVIDGTINLGLEIVSDPFNWVSFGGKQAVSSSVKAGTKAMSDTLVKEIGQEAGDKLTKRIVKTTTKNILRDANEEQITKSLNKVLKSYIPSETSSVVRKTVSENVDNIIKSTLSDINIGKKVYDFSEGLQSKLLKASGSSIWVPYKVIKTGKQLLDSKINKGLVAVNKADLFNFDQLAARTRELTQGMPVAQTIELRKSLQQASLNNNRSIVTELSDKIKNTLDSLKEYRLDKTIYSTPVTQIKTDSKLLTSAAPQIKTITDNSIKNITEVIIRRTDGALKDIPAYLEYLNKAESLQPQLKAVRKHLDDLIEINKWADSVINSVDPTIAVSNKLLSMRERLLMLKSHRYKDVPVEDRARYTIKTIEEVKLIADAQATINPELSQALYQTLDIYEDVLNRIVSNSYNVPPYTRVGTYSLSRYLEQFPETADAIVKAGSPTATAIDKLLETVAPHKHKQTLISNIIPQPHITWNVSIDDMFANNYKQQVANLNEINKLIKRNGKITGDNKSFRLESRVVTKFDHMGKELAQKVVNQLNSNVDKVMQDIGVSDIDQLLDNIKFSSPNDTTDIFINNYKDSLYALYSLKDTVDIPEGVSKRLLTDYEDNYNILQYIIDDNKTVIKTAGTAQASKALYTIGDTDKILEYLSPENIIDTIEQTSDDALTQYTGTLINLEKDAEEIFYVIKRANSYNTAKFISLDSMGRLLAQLDTPGSTFNQVLDYVGPLGKELREQLEAYRAYKNLVENIFAIDKNILSTDMASSILDALNTYQRMDVKDINDFIDDVLSKVKRDAATNNRMRSVDYLSLGLEEIPKRMDWLVKDEDGVIVEFAKKTGGKAHQAAYDTLVNKAIVTDPRSKYYNAFQETLGSDDYIPIFFDLETTGLSKYTGNIIQIGISSGDNYVKQINAISNHVPIKSVREKLHYATVEDFKAVHSVELNPNAVSEADAIKTFMAEVERIAEETGKIPVLCGHNIKGFDNAQIIARAKAVLPIEEANNIERLFRKVRKIDTWDIVKAVENYEDVTDEAMAEVRALLLEYNTYLIDNGIQKFIQPVSRKLVNNLLELANVAEEVDKKLSKANKSSAYTGRYQASIIFDEYRQTAKEVSDILNQIAEDNKALSSEVYAKSDFVKQNTNIINALEKGTHGIQQYSARTLVNVKLINDYFDFKRKGITTLELSRRTTTGKYPLNPLRFSSAARRMDTRVSYIKNMEFLLRPENKQAIYELAEAIRSFVDTGVININGTTIPVNIALGNTYIPYMRVALDTPALNYAMIEESLMFLKANPTVLKAFEETLPEVTVDLFTKYRNAGVADNIGVLWRGFIDDTLIKEHKQIRQVLRRPAYENNVLFPDVDVPDFVMPTFEALPNSLLEAQIAIGHLIKTIHDSKDIGEAFLRGLEDTQLSTTAPLRYNSYRDKLLKIFLDTQDYFKELTYREYKNIRGLISNSIEDLGSQQIKHVISLQGDDLLEYLFDAGGRVSFVANKNILSKETIDLWKTQGAEVFYKKIFDNDNVLYFIVLNKNKYEYCKSKFITGTSLSVSDIPKYNAHVNKLKQTPVVLYKIGQGNQFINTLNAFRQALNEIMPGVGYTTGGYLTSNHLKQIDSWLPDEALDYVIPTKALVADGFFDTMHYQKAIIGPMNGRVLINPYAVYNPLKEMASTYLQSLNKLSATAQFSSLYYNDLLSINKSPLFGEQYLKDTDIFKMLKEHDELVVTALVKDNHTSHGYRAALIKINTIKDIKIARNLDASIMPINTYLDVAKVINHFNKMPPVMRFINGFITSTYKTGFLGSIGTVFRNLLDGILKNGITAGEPMEIPRSLSHWFDTTKLYRKYLEEEQMFHAWRIRTFGEQSKITKQMFEDYFNKNTTHLIDADIFNLIYTFIKEGPSGGMTKQMQEYYSSVTKNIRELQGLDKAIASYNSVLKNLPFIKPLQSMNHHVEQTLRLSSFLKAVEEGASIPEAMAKVLKTHFDYSAKSYTTRMVETLFPFVGFTLKNLEYYADAFANKGWFAGLFRDFMIPVFRFNEDKDSEINYKTLKRTTIWEDPLGISPSNKFIPMSELYHILNGNIQIDTGITNPDDERKKLMFVLKLNPSVMDALNFMSNPIESITGRALPIIRTAKDIITGDATNDYVNKSITEQIIEALPLVGTTYQRTKSAIKNLDKTDNLLTLIPSMFGVSSTYREFNPEEPPTDVSERLVKMWYAKYKTGNKDEKYNPYNYYPSSNKKTYTTTIEKFIAKKFSEYKKYNLPANWNPYSRYAHLLPPEKRAVYEPFDPVRAPKNASEAQVRAWYQYHKDHNLPYKLNPYKYYPEYNKFKTKGVTKSIASDSVYKNMVNMYMYHPNLYSATSMLKLINRFKVQQFYNRYFTSKGKPRSQLAIQSKHSLQARTVSYLYNKMSKRYYSY